MTAFNGPAIFHVPGAPPAPPAPGAGHTGVVQGPTGMERVAPPKGTPIVFPWWLYEMPGSVDWEINAMNFSVSGATPTVITDFALAVEQGYRSVCTMLTLTVLNPTTTMDLRFRLLLSGGPVVGWSRIQPPPLSATAFVKDYNGMVVRMDETQQFAADASENSGATFTCSLQARGWFVPKATIAQFMSGVPY